MNAALCTKTIYILELLYYTLLIRSCDLKYYEKDLVQMKHKLKRLSATALAFVLLGAGSVVTKNVAPKSDNTLTAYAASCTHCHGGSYHVASKYDVYRIPIGYNHVYYMCIETVYCSLCGTTLETHVY